MNNPKKSGKDEEVKTNGQKKSGGSNGSKGTGTPKKTRHSGNNPHSRRGGGNPGARAGQKSSSGVSGSDQKPGSTVPPAEGAGSEGSSGHPSHDKCQINAYSWYGEGQPLTEAATSISTAFVYGSAVGKFDVADEITSIGITDNTPDAKYGRLMSIQTSFFVPDETGASTGKITELGLFYAGQAMYNALRGTKTSTVPFDPIDVTCYILAQANILALAGHINRRLQIISSAKIGDLYWPIAINAALAGTASIATNRASGDLTLTWRNRFQVEQEEYAINVTQFKQLLVQLQALPLPAGIPLLERANSIFARVFADSNDYNGANKYVLTPGILYEYDLATHGMLPVRTAHTKIADDLTLLQEMIYRIVSDSSMAEIATWIRVNLNDYYSFEPIDCYDHPDNDEYLGMIMNSHTMPSYASGPVIKASGGLYKNENSIYNVDPATQLGRNELINCLPAMELSKKLFSYNGWDNSKIMEFTRFKPQVVSAGVVNHFTFHADFFNFNQYNIYFYQGGALATSGNDHLTRFAFSSSLYVDSNLTTDTANVAAVPATIRSEIESLLAGFDYHPVIWFFDAGSTTAPYTTVLDRIYGHDTYCLELQAGNLEKLHTAAIYGEVGLYSALMASFFMLGK